VTADIRELPLQDLFDCVLVDAPCSGTGTLARNPEIKWRLKPEDLEDLPARQVAILQSAMQHVAPHGTLIYSTCSLEPEEDEDVVSEALIKNPSFQLGDVRPQLEALRAAGEFLRSDLDTFVRGPYLRTIPGIHPCDGFFVAMLKRTH
jgi:16S rRNA (cytosine967-C5)-methyltransferase